MMRSLFTIGCLISVASARRWASKRVAVQPGDDPQFVKFAAENNKNYRDTTDFRRRESNWKQSDELIKKTNAKADSKKDGRALKLAHNHLSDLEEDEYLALLGLSEDYDESKKVRDMRKGGAKKGKGRKLNIDAVSTGTDHVELGHMTAVKEQGQCGSCWAFVATSVLEGTISSLKKTAPVRLSEQQLVDCTNQNSYKNWGCRGGWMDRAWWYQRDRGAMTEADYPYVGTDGASCLTDSTKIAAKTLRWGQVTSSVEDMQAKLDERPLSIAIDASSREFMLYSSGVLDGTFTTADGTTSECGTALNHAVTLVGYSLGGEQLTTIEYEIK